MNKSLAMPKVIKRKYTIQTEDFDTDVFRNKYCIQINKAKLMIKIPPCARELFSKYNPGKPAMAKKIRIWSHNFFFELRLKRQAEMIMNHVINEAARI